MSYNQYNPYDSYDDAGDRNRAYDPLDDNNGPGYGSPRAHEMSSYGQTQTNNDNTILDECKDISRGIEDAEDNMARLAILQKRCLEDVDTSGQSDSKREVDLLTQAIMDQLRRLADRIRDIKTKPDSGLSLNANQVDRVKRALEKAVGDNLRQEQAFREASQSQMERQIRIVRPDATDEEIRNAVEQNSPVFQQALMRGNRSKQAEQVFSAVKARHDEMLEVERKLGELLDLLENMNQLLVKQEVTVMAIDTHAENAAEDMVKANDELEVAVTTARKTRKKKWICLGICVTIVIIIVVAVVAYIMVNRASNGGGNNNNNDNNNNNNQNQNQDNNGNAAGQKRGLFQRNVLDDLKMNNIGYRTIKIAGDHPAARDILPSTELSRRRLNRARTLAAPERQVVAPSERRFVVDWEGADPAV